MNIILGFGVTETKTALRVIKECYNLIKNNPNKLVCEVIKEVEQRYKELSNNYDKMSRSEVPERYSCFWARKSGEVIIFDFHHINRQHSMSPDGWALLKSFWILDIETGGIFEKTGEASS